MMDVLKRFEEDAAAEDEDREDDSDPEDELAARLEEVDLDAMPTDELWELLSPEQRARFMEAVNNPEGEMAKTLLASEEVARDMRPPWWETHAHGEPATSQDTTPLPVRIPTRMIKPLPEEQVSLVYNYVAICLAYTYTVRHLALPSIAQVADDDALEAKRLLRTLVPFLFDRRSRTIFAGLQEAVTDVWSRMNETIPSAPLFAVLLKDVAVLLKPLLVVASFNGGSESVPSADAETVDPTTLPQATPIIVLSDLTELFENPQGEATTPLTPAGHKLLFYAAHLASTPPPVLQLVADEAKTRASLFEREAQETAVSRAGGRPPTTRHTPIIEELP